MIRLERIIDRVSSGSCRANRVRTGIRATALGRLFCLGLLLAGMTAAAAPRKNQAPATAENLAAQAAVVAQRGEFALAAKMFHSAFTLNPNAWEYLYSAARSEQLANNIEAARRDYARYLAGAPANDPLRERATEHAATVEKAYAQAAKEAEQAAEAAERARLAQSRRPVEAPVDEQSPNPRMIAGWASVAVGAIGVGAGAWMYSDARRQKSDLEAKTKTSGGGLIYPVSYQEAQTAADSIRGDLRLGGAILGAGAAVMALGGWLVWTSTGPTAVAIGIGGQKGESMTVAWSF